ncbi:MAG: peptide/nickel transport system ATP-binding protein [Chloroflexota bacterium]|nr:peptide/nickel transport system ATP-binding protein [Chloroflexota bacterium]
MPTIDIRDLTVRFATNGGAVHAVRGVSLAVEPGRVLGVVGESGSGKSATCRAALGLLPPNATVTGSAWFEGRDLLSLAERELRHIRGRRIGWIFQDPMSSLNPVRSIGDQLREAITIHERVGRSEARRRILEALSDVGFPVAERRLGAFPHELSGGLRQRVMIAMAMINRPALLIADEPTSALDVTTQAQILELLARLTRGSGTAVILITHDLGVVDRICDDVVVMYAGSIVEASPTAQLFGRPAHPYSWGLMGSLPSLGIGGRLRPIPGSPPRLDREPNGCAFAPRCEAALEMCTTVVPALTPEIDQPAHRFACHLDVPTRHGHAAALARAVSDAGSTAGRSV